MLMLGPDKQHLLRAGLSGVTPDRQAPILILSLPTYSLPVSVTQIPQSLSLHSFGYLLILDCVSQRWGCL